MKGIIVLSSYFLRKKTDAHKFLFKMICDNHDFRIVYSDTPIIPTNVDIVILYHVPIHSRPSLMVEEFVNFNKDVKLVGYLGDLQHYGNQTSLTNMKRMMDRYDAILSPCSTYFNEHYPEYTHKHHFFPNFIAPYERYSNLIFNENPEMRCLLSGAIEPRAYPLRDFIIKTGHSKLDHIGPILFGNHQFFGDNYARLLNYYACVIATKGLFDGMVSKYFEIPASGALMLANIASDLKFVGLSPYEHFIPIDETNVFNIVEIVLNNYSAYDNVRRSARKFILANHTVLNRYKQLENILVNL